MSNNLDQAIDKMMSNKDNSDADGNKLSDEVSCDKKEETGENNLSNVSKSSDEEIGMYLSSRKQSEGISNELLR